MQGSSLIYYVEESLSVLFYFEQKHDQNIGSVIIFKKLRKKKRKIAKKCVYY